MLGVQALGPFLGCGASPESRPGTGEGPDEVHRPCRAAEAEPAPVEDLRERARREEREAWLVLMMVSGLGPVTLEGLLRAFGSGREVLEIATCPRGVERLAEAVATLEPDPDRDERDGRQRRRIGEDLARRICEHAAAKDVLAGRVAALGLEVVTLEDQQYPSRLRGVEMPPPLLFVRGSLEAMEGGRAIAVVGTRRATDRGRRVAAWIGSAVSRAGAVVVSGLAVGIDGAAHAAAVAEGLPTVAVLGGGHARLFPAAHARLADAIVAAGGTVVAELPPDTPPTRGTFPRRNRLISGLSDATVVVEAGRRSGALITAGWALEQGRECFLVPGPLDAPQSAGCNEFLRTFGGQARIVAGIPELLEDLDLVVGADGRGAWGVARAGDVALAPGRGAVLASLAGLERAIADALVGGPATADHLARVTASAPAAVLSALTLLELRGLVTSAYGRFSAAGLLAGWSADEPAGGRRGARRAAQRASTAGA